MPKHRVLVDFQTAGDAKKVEETVKTGYAEVTLENLTHWIAAEEDLVSSYELLASKPEYASSKGTFEELAKESKETVALLSALRKSVEDLDSARVKRIGTLEKVH